MSDAMKQARGLLAQALEVSADSLSDDTSMNSSEAWDSLAHIRVIAAIENHLGGELDTMEILEIEQLSDIAAILERHSAAA
jgi:acyl carrier protein